MRDPKGADQQGGSAANHQIKQARRADRAQDFARQQLGASDGREQEETKRPALAVVQHGVAREHGRDPQELAVDQKVVGAYGAAGRHVDEHRALMTPISVLSRDCVCPSVLYRETSPSVINTTKATRPYREPTMASMVGCLRCSSHSRRAICKIRCIMSRERLLVEPVQLSGFGQYALTLKSLLGAYRAFDDDRAIAQVFRGVEVVRHDHDRDALLGLFADGPMDRARGQRIQIGRWLVQQKQPRVEHERAREGETF